MYWFNRVSNQLVCGKDKKWVKVDLTQELSKLCGLSFSSVLTPKNSVAQLRRGPAGSLLIKQTNKNL